jgi:hypothetical protein
MVTLAKKDYVKISLRPHGKPFLLSISLDVPEQEINSGFPLTEKAIENILRDATSIKVVFLETYDPLTRSGRKDLACS